MTSTSYDRARGSILQYLGQTLGHDQVKDLSPSDNLITGQFLDSMGFLDLLFYLEEHFGIEINLSEYDPKNYTSVDGFSQILGEIIV